MEHVLEPLRRFFRRQFSVWLREQASDLMFLNSLGKTVYLRRSRGKSCLLSVLAPHEASSLGRDVSVKKSPIVLEDIRIKPISRGAPVGPRSDYDVAVPTIVAGRAKGYWDSIHPAARFHC